jgi:hypothetical protein
MKFNGLDGTFHHIGIPSSEPHPGERYSESMKMYTSDALCLSLRVQWHRFEEDSPLHPLLRTVPHAAFKVADLASAIAGYDVLLGPYEPIPGFYVAIIQDGGIPIELVQTDLSDDELWTRAITQPIP